MKTLPLTPAEREIARMLSHGMTYEAIAAARGVQPGTIKAIVAQVMRKHGIGRVQLAALAVEEKRGE